MQDARRGELAPNNTSTFSPSFFHHTPSYFIQTHFEEIESTQDYLRDHIDQLLLNNDRVVITADFQTKGRGTNNRRWASPPHVNIYATFGFKLEPFLKHVESADELFKYPIIVQCATLAVAKTLEQYSFTPRIKWRNDLLLDQKKVCGILCERVVMKSGEIAGLVGIGLNVNMDQQTCETLDQPVTSMMIQAKHEFKKTEVFETLSKQIGFHLQMYVNTGFNAYIQEITKKMEFIGEPIRVQDDDDKIQYQGIFKGIDDKGQLILELADSSLKVIRIGSILKENYKLLELSTQACMPK